MKKFNVKRLISLIIVGLLLVGIQIVFANEMFQNNLLKIHLFKNPLGEIKVLLLTNKQYKDAVVANKKSDFEYVILMPETANSLTERPKLDLVSDIVKNIEIKTMQYQNGLKGYTKITIHTVNPVAVLPQTQVFSSSTYKLGESDYNELLAQTAKKQPTKTKTVSKPIKKEVTIVTKPQITAASKTVKSTSKYIEQPKQLKKAVDKQKPSIKYAPSKTKFSKKIKTQTTQIAIKKSVKTIKSTRPTAKHVVAKSVPKASKTAIKTSPVEKVTPVVPVKTVSIPETKPSNLSYAPESKPAVIGKDVINPPYEPQKTEPSEPATVNEVSTVQQPMSKINIPAEQKVEAVSALNNSILTKYKELIKNNLYLIGGGLTAFFLVLLLIAKNMNKTAKTRKETFVSHLKEKPVNVTKLSEKITDDMTWKEKFQTYTEATKTDTETTESTYIPPAKKGELDELFAHEETSQQPIEPDIFSQDTTIAEPVLPEPESEQVLEENVSEELYSFDEYKTAIYGESQKPISSGIVDLEHVDNIDEINEEDISIEELFADEQPSQEFIVEPPKTLIEQPAVIPSPQGIEADEEVVEPDNLVKSEFSIDDNKGFYLVDFEDSTALVGHINDEIFVLKRFNERINARLQARVNEKSTNSVSFMTKVGDFKGVVEVTPDNMRLLIEL